MVTGLCTVCWVFAFKYYELSLMLDKFLANNEINKSKAKNLNRFMLVNILVWPVIESGIYLSINLNRHKKNLVALEFVGGIIGLISMLPLPISCALTTIAFRKITEITENSI